MPLAAHDVENVYVEYVSYSRMGLRRKLKTWFRMHKDAVTFGLIITGLALSAFFMFRAVASSRSKASAPSEARMVTADSSEGSPEMSQEASAGVRSFDCFANLEATEIHYRPAAAFVLSTGNFAQPIRLRYIADREKRVILCALPIREPGFGSVVSAAMYNENVSDQSRAFDWLSTDQVTGKAFALSHQVFQYTETGSSTRLADYRRALRLAGTKTASQHVRIARAAIDFGEYEVAQAHLRMAGKAVNDLGPDSRSTAQASRLQSSIGQTYLMMGDANTGKSFIDEAKAYWESNLEWTQLGGLHQIYLWNAQFSAFNRDIESMKNSLGEFAAVVSKYALPPSQLARMIEDAYVTCMVLAGDPDVELPVPAGMIVHEPELGWTKPANLFAKYKGEGFPPGLQWREPVKRTANRR